MSLGLALTEKEEKEKIERFGLIHSNSGHRSLHLSRISYSSSFVYRVFHTRTVSF